MHALQKAGLNKIFCQKDLVQSWMLANAERGYVNCTYRLRLTGIYFIPTEFNRISYNLLGTPSKIEIETEPIQIVFLAGRE